MQDHHLKHSPGRHVTFHQDGRLEWITPTGHRYFSDPHAYRPDDPPLPPPPPPRRPTTGPPPTPPDRNARRDWDGFSRYFEQAEPADPDDAPPC